MAAGTAPAITTFKIDNRLNPPSNTISSSNGVDYYYTSPNIHNVFLSITTSNTTDLSISETSRLTNPNVQRISVINTQDTVVYSYSLGGTNNRNIVDYTITLTNNGAVNQIYYLHLSGFRITPP